MISVSYVIMADWVLKSSNIKKPLIERLMLHVDLKVNLTGKMSNFLVEDYEAVLKFMKTEKNKKKILKR